MRNFYSCLLILILVIVVHPAAGQNRNFIVTSIDEGLPNSNVSCIFNDSRGNLWIGTETGMCCFDGNSYKTYSLKDGLPGNWVRAITEDKYGRIWVGTDNGLSIFNGRTFSNYKTIGDSATLTIYTFFNDSKKNIWIGTSGKGAIKAEFIADSLHFTLYDESNGVESPHIFTICEINNRIVLGSFGKGLYVVSDSKVSNFQHPLLPSNYILSSKVDNYGNVYFSTYNSGVFLINSRKGDQYWPNNVSQIECNIDDSQVWDVLIDNEQLWIATNNKGVGRINAKNTGFCDKTNGLQSDFVYKLYQDNEDNIWFGTNGGGLVHFLGDHFAHYNKDDGLPSIVNTIKQHPDGYYVLGTSDGVYKLTYNQNKPVFELIKGIKENTLINSIDIDKQGKIWIGTANEGLVVINKNKIERHNSSSGLINNEVTCVFVDSQQRIWVGTIGGITIINNNTYFSIDTIGYKFSNNAVQSIAEDKEGAVWVATLSGVVKFKNNSSTSFVEEDGLLEKSVTSLAVGETGLIWIGTQGGGLYLLNEKLKKPVKKIADDKILSSNTIYSLLLLDKNTLICGTNKGFDKITLKADTVIESVINYDKTNGFFGEENRSNAIFKDKQENVWFGTAEYLTRYSPKFEKHERQTPKLQINKIKLFFKDYESRDTTKLNNFFGVSDSISFSHNQNHITFQFTGISLRNPLKVIYSYMLEGLETEWSPPRSSNEVIYSGLKPGNYIFKVRSMGENGIWNKEPVTFRFEIRPPFWQRWWFYAIIVVIGFIILVLVISWRERKFRLAKQLLEQLVHERTVEVVRQKEEIEIQRDEIGRQHDIVQTQNKDITDSIIYAKRIQTAVMTSATHIKDSFSSYFVLFMPRNIVSGDFYWFGGTPQYTVVVAADCTGHGVPGAFMSMLGITLLNKIINEQKNFDPAKILDSLRNDVICSLQQNDPGAVNKDGMDITMVVIDNNKNRMSFVGANNSMYFVRNGEVTQYKGDKMPVAIYLNMQAFKSTEIDIQKGDRFYLMSDGYEDQFGGPNGKKFMSKQLVQLIRDFNQVPMLEQGEAFKKRFEEWKCDIEQVDDVLLMGFEI